MKVAYDRCTKTLRAWDGERDGECIDIRAPLQIFPKTRWDLVAIGESGNRPAVTARMRGARVMLLASSLETWLESYGGVKPENLQHVMQRLRMIHRKFDLDLSVTTGKRAPKGPRKPRDRAPEKLKATSTELWSVWGRS